MLKITDVSFITSAANKSQFIRADKPIIAVCGKSNVGKSSFINMLANRKKLARVSKDPGRTRLVNYFDFGPFILADLPGYGFAKVSKEEKQRWARLMEDFFSDRANCSPEIMEAIKNDIIKVISKYMDVDTEALDIQITQTPSEDGHGPVPALFANIPIKDLKNGNPNK